MDKDNKNEELDNTDKKLHISDVSCSLSQDEQKELCNKLRIETGCGINDCKNNLIKNNWNYDITKKILQYKKRIMFYNPCVNGFKGKYKEFDYLWDYDEIDKEIIVYLYYKTEWLFFKTEKEFQLFIDGL